VRGGRVGGAKPERLRKGGGEGVFEGRMMRRRLFFGMCAIVAVTLASLPAASASPSAGRSSDE
jgi:hypothetical protein